MSDEQSNDTVSTTDIYRDEIDPDPDEANYEFLELLADLEGCDVTELPPMHSRIDDLVAEIFQDPPSPAAQVQLQFSYYGYRVTVEQNGTVTLIKLNGDDGVA